MSPFALRLWGSVLVAAAGAAAGAEAAWRTRRRLADLRALEAGLRVLGSEVAFAVTPLPAALARAARVAGGGAGELLAAVGEGLERRGLGPEAAWREAWTVRRGRMAVRREDVEAVEELMASLGRSHREDQTAHVARAAERLASLAARLAPEAERVARVQGALGLLGGLAAAILVL
jgi:stage III sporulation protein AB